MIRYFKLIAVGLIFSFLSIKPVFAEWNFESENKSSGISAYATTFWVEGVGPISLDRLMQLEGDIEEGSYWSTLMVSCVRKKLIISINLNMAGSANRDISLDDPGYAYLRFDLMPLRKYRTYGLNIPSSINFSTDAKAITSSILKSTRLALTVRDRVAREKIPMVFDLTGFAKGKTRFRYAGCKL